MEDRESVGLALRDDGQYRYVLIPSAGSRQRHCPRLIALSSTRLLACADWVLGQRLKPYSRVCGSCTALSSRGGNTWQSVAF